VPKEQIILGEILEPLGAAPFRRMIAGRGYRSDFPKRTPPHTLPFANRCPKAQGEFPERMMVGARY
jgi:hypothetical protein